MAPSPSTTAGLSANDRPSYTPAHRPTQYSDPPSSHPGDPPSSHPDDPPSIIFPMFHDATLQIHPPLLQTCDQRSRLAHLENTRELDGLLGLTFLRTISNGPKRPVEHAEAARSHTAARVRG